jgi:hypothetical protein
MECVQHHAPQFVVDGAYEFGISACPVGPELVLNHASFHPVLLEVDLSLGCRRGSGLEALLRDSARPAEEQERDGQADPG